MRQQKITTVSRDESGADIDTLLLIYRVTLPMLAK